MPARSPCPTLPHRQHVALRRAERVAETTADIENELDAFNGDLTAVRREHPDWPAEAFAALEAKLAAAEAEHRAR